MGKCEGVERPHPEQLVKLVDSVEERDVVFGQTPEGLDVGHPEADSDQASLSRARRPIKVHDRPAGMKHSIVDTRFPYDQVPAASRTSFPGSSVQSRTKKIGRHLPIDSGRGPDELIYRGERPRDVLRRKAVAQPLTSANQLAIRRLYN